MLLGLINKRYVRTSCFFVAALLFSLAEQRAASADSFLNPARNSYSLSKTMDRPFLQSVPVPQVWQTDSSSGDFRNALLDATLPESKEERLLAADLWQTEALDMQNDFQTIALDDQLSEKMEIADVLNDIMPVISLANDDAVGEVEKIEDDFDRFQMSLSEKNVELLSKRLVDMNSFFEALKEVAPMEVELEAFQEFSRKKSAQETQIVTELAKSFLSDDVLNQAEKIYSYEQSEALGIRDVEEVYWSLLINDASDLSTGANMLLFDEDFPEGEKFENPYRSASLLDRAEKNDQIQGDRFLADKQALMKRLPKELEDIEAEIRRTRGQKTKDRKTKGAK